MNVIPLSQPVMREREVAADHHNSKPGKFEMQALPFLKQLYRTALILTGSPRRAQELSYYTFLQARRERRRIGNNKDFGLWMFRVLLERLLLTKLEQP